MRTPKYRERADGTPTWKVRYRSATGAQKSETFIDDEAGALEFCKLLDALGPARAVAYIDERAKAQGVDQGKAYTLDDLFELWIEYKAKRRNEIRSARTIHDYRRMYERGIKPLFGHMPANLVSQGDVQHWIDNLDRSPKTVADYHSLLHAVYKWAFHPARGYVVNDPCADTDLPKRRKTPPKGLRPNEWLILHQAALVVDQDVADLLLFMASTGWRFSECVAVQAMGVDHWIDQDGTSQTFVTMGRVLRREGGHFAFVEEAKSDAGHRRVRVVGPGEEMILRRVVGKKPSDLLLTTQTGSRWAYTVFYERYWTRPKGGRDKVPNRRRILEVARELGLDREKISPHWLRHTHVGMLILAGEPLTAIQRRLGHASIKTTSDTYGRMIEDASDAGLSRVAAMLGGSAARELEV